MEMCLSKKPALATLPLCAQFQFTPTNGAYLDPL